MFAVPALPQPPKNLVVLEVTFDSVRLAWNSTNSSTTTPPIKSYVVQYRHNGSSDDCWNTGEEARDLGGWSQCCNSLRVPCSCCKWRRPKSLCYACSCHYQSCGLVQLSFAFFLLIYFLISKVFCCSSEGVVAYGIGIVLLFALVKVWLHQKFQNATV